eukprot:10003288-Alexandrium_andersonii.AAC.1
MSASLVGSEMCIRDRACGANAQVCHIARHLRRCMLRLVLNVPGSYVLGGCLLYTSDAADDM